MFAPAPAGNSDSDYQSTIALWGAKVVNIISRKCQENVKKMTHDFINIFLTHLFSTVLTLLEYP